MYQTLYRKYRPKTFKDVVGQDVIVKTLKNEVRNNKLNHAYLFAGPRGTGKTSIAKLLAKTINCSNLQEINPCDKCVSCTQINNHQSTDIIEIDAASNNGVDEIRELKSKINLVPSNSKYKVYIIDEVHMLTIGAFNALLKTLEEPPAHIIFILATTDPHKIPTTILSRCQRFDFKKVSVNCIVDRLSFIAQQEQIKIEQEALLEIARLSDGGMRDSLSMLDQALAFCENKITLDDIHEINGTLSQENLKQFVVELFNQRLGNVLDMLDNFNSQGKNLVKLTEEIISFLRDILLLKTIPNYFSQDENKQQLLEKISQEIKNEKLLRLIKELNMTLTEMHSSNNPKLLLELCLIKFSINMEVLTDNSFNINTNICSDKEKIPIIDEKTNGIDSIILDEEQIINKNEKAENTIELNSVITSDNYKKNDQAIEKKIKTLKNIRVNNTLAGYSRKKFMEFKKNMEDLRSLLINPKYSKYVSMILDADLKAVGNNNMIFVYNDAKLSDIFNLNLIEIEKVLFDYFNVTYKVIATDIDDWNIIKKEFNSKKGQYVVQEEPESIDDILNSLISETAEEEDSDEIKQLFGNIVEYN